MWNSTPLIVAAQYGQLDIALLLLGQSDVGKCSMIMMVVV